MSTPEFKPPMTPSIGVVRKPEIKLLRAEFGDGYTQTAANGMNHIREVLQLRWDVLTKDEADEIEGFLRERGGWQSFTYRLPYAERERAFLEPGDEGYVANIDRQRDATYERPAMKFTCDDWQITQSAAFHYAIDATFRQDFSL